MGGDYVTVGIPTCVGTRFCIQNKPFTYHANLGDVLCDILFVCVCVCVCVCFICVFGCVYTRINK